MVAVVAAAAAGSWIGAAEVAIVVTAVVSVAGSVLRSDVVTACADADASDATTAAAVVVTTAASCHRTCRVPAA